MKILEWKFRGSVICHTLGYPITYAIVKLLLEKGPMGLDEITKRVNRAKNTVCGHLTKLKLTNIIRFEKTKFKTIYWIKYPEEVKEFMSVCEKLVKRTARNLDHDY